MMFKRYRSILSILDVHFLLLGTSNPVGKLQIIWDSCRQHHNADSVRQLHDDLFPDTATLFIVDVVDFIEYDPLDVLYLAAVIIQHRL